MRANREIIVSDLDAMFGGDSAVEAEALPVTQEQQATPPVEDVTPPQDVPAAPEAIAAPVVPVAPEMPSNAPPAGFVPVQEVQRLRAKLREMEGQREAPPMPDVFEQPEAYTSALQAQIQQATLAVKLDLSEAQNADRHGEQTVEEAKEWALARFGQNPAFQAEVLGQRDPYGYVIKQMKREKALSALGDADPQDIAAFQAWKAAQAQLAAAPVAAVPPPSLPPVSLASAPNAAGPSSAPKPDPVAAKLATMF
jgi:hypothetical protein